MLLTNQESILKKRNITKKRIQELDGAPLLFFYTEDENTLVQAFLPLVFGDIIVHSAGKLFSGVCISFACTEKSKFNDAAILFNYDANTQDINEYRGVYQCSDISGIMDITRKLVIKRHDDAWKSHCLSTNTKCAIDPSLQVCGCVRVPTCVDNLNKLKHYLKSTAVFFFVKSHRMTFFIYNRSL